MTLPKRLTKLEAQRQSKDTSPRVIFHDAVWRTDDGDLQSIAAFAKALTATAWQTVTTR